MYMRMMIRSIDAVIQMLDADYIENIDIEDYVHGVSIDSRTVIKGNLYIPIIGERYNGHVFAKEAVVLGARCILWQKSEGTPPIDVDVILVDDTLKALQKLAKMYRDQLQLTIIGITGSNGKTSTKDILAAILATTYRTQKTLGNQNNEIGVPLTLLSFSEHTQVGVVEIGMEYEGDVAFLTNLIRPNIALITNVGSAHLENLGSVEGIAAEKASMIAGIQDKGMLVYNGDQEILRNAIREKEVPGHIRIKTFGESKNNDCTVTNVYQKTKYLTFSIQKKQYTLDMIGQHQALNASAAYLVAKALHIEDNNIQEGFMQIEKSGLRNELCYIDQCTILNDAYKSNPQSAYAALETLAQFEINYKIAVFSDMLDLGKQSQAYHQELGRALIKFPFQEILTYGNMATFISQAIMETQNHNKIIKHFSKKSELIKYLKPYTKQKCMILLKGSRKMKLEEVVEKLQGNEVQS